MKTNKLQKLRNNTAYAVGACLLLAAAAHASTFIYPDFSSTSGLNLVDDASQMGSFIRLTPVAQAQYGAMWYSAKQHVADGFATTFQFRISQPTDLGGGDGIGFSLQNVGNTAHGWEYGAFSNNFGITLNTFNNGGQEPSDNFVGIVHQYDSAGNAIYDSVYDLNSTPIRLKDGNIHSATLLYNGSGMSMFIDGISIFSNVGVNLGDGVDGGGNSFVGFSARTGLATENHDILSWSFATIPEPSSAAILGVGALVLGRRRLMRR